MNSDDRAIPAHAIQPASVSLRGFRMLRSVCSSLLCASLAWAGSALAAPPPVEVFAAVVEPKPFVDRIEALGTLRANESITLTATVTDTISALHFDDGDRVQAGAVLVEMNHTEEEALLQEARVTAAEAKRQYQRVKSLESSGTAAKSQLDERLREWEAAQARVSAIESRLADRMLRAPFAGVVGFRNVSLGSLVAPGDPITTLDDDSVMKLDMAVPAGFLSVLKPGLRVEAITSAYGDRVFRGEVASVGSRVDPVTRTVTVRARVPNPDRALRPGMLLQTVLLNNARQSLAVPEQALLAEGEKHFVLLVDEAGKAVKRAIRTGTRRPGEVEVLEGLARGDKVVTEGAIKLRPGQTVKVIGMSDGDRPRSELLKTGSAKP